MATRAHVEMDAAGWKFWAISFVVLVGPLVYVSWQIVYDTAPWYAPLGIGVFAAAIASSLASWAVNAVLFQRQKRRRQAARKQAKKRK